MLNFGAKNVKTQGKNCLQLNFQPGYCEDVNSVVRQTEKTLNKLKLLGKQKFDEFLKHRKKRTKKFVAIRSEM